MTWPAVQAKLRYWTPGAWDPTGWNPIRSLTTDELSVIPRTLELLYASATARSQLNNLTSGTKTLKIGGLADTLKSPAYAGGSGRPDEGLQIDLVQASNVYWFNATGSLVLGDLSLVIAHELSHLADDTVYPNGVGYSDPSGSSGQPPSDAQQNASTFDPAGKAVRDQNTVAKQLGLTDQTRVSYGGTSYPGVRAELKANVSYTDGKTVKIVRFGDGSINLQDHTARTDNSTDLIFGFGGNDQIFGGGGGDFLYGGDGSDEIRGGLGNDALYGDGGGDFLFGNEGTDLIVGGANANVITTDLTTDGYDTADYSTFVTGTSGKGVTIQVTATPASTLYQGNGDFSHAVFVTDQVRDKAIDTLISVETIKATAADDILKIDSLDAVRLAGSSGQGGLVEVDLGAETKKTLNKGDLVDLSNLDEAALVRGNADGSVYVDAKADTSREIIVNGAEHILGSKQDDLFKLNGALPTIDFVTGGGHDLVETSAGGTYDLLLQGLKPADIEIIAGGEDLYNSYAYYASDIAFEFVAFKVKATGDTITFVDNTRAVGTANSPDYSVAGVDYAKAHSAISTVAFSDGTKWTSDQLWSRIGDRAANPSVTWDLMFRGFGDERTESQLVETKSDTYDNRINSLYFQADPIGSGAPSASAPGFSKAAVLTAPMTTNAEPDDANTSDLSSSSASPQVSPINPDLNQSFVARPPTDSLTALAGVGAHDEGFQKAAATPTSTESGSQLADAALALRSHNSARKFDLSRLTDPTANLVGYGERPRPQVYDYGTAPASDAVSAANYNKLIEAMAAFQAGDRTGTVDASAIRPHDLGLHALTLAAAH